MSHPRLFLQGHSDFTDGDGDLVCVCVYKRGAIEIARRLTSALALGDCYLRETPPEPAREPLRALPEVTYHGE